MNQGQQNFGPAKPTKSSIWHAEYTVCEPSRGGTV